MKYPNLFSPVKLGDVVFKNRLFAAPTAMVWSSDNGSPTDSYIYYYEDKARGGAGSVTISETCVSADYAPRRPGSDIALGVASHSHVPVFIKLTSAISRHGAVPSIQLFHSGESSWPRFIGGKNPIGPSARVREDGVTVDEMSLDLIDRTIKDFADAAAFVKSVGFRMLMLHGAHGWLLTQFLSSATNKRTDQYGGTLENRARFIIRIIDAVREKVGPGFPIEYRISGDEHLKNGMEIDEVIEFCKLIDGKVDLIHISAGSYYASEQYTFPTIYAPHGLNVDMAAKVKAAVSTPVATVGAHADPAEAERIIRDGLADIVYMGRQIIADPETPNKARTGREDEIVRCTRCINCIGNFGKGFRDCDVNPIAGNEVFTLRSVRPVISRKKVLVAGGGPGGMKAAITAAERGHEVILAEKTDSLGGMLKFTDRDVWKEDLRHFKNYLINMVGKSNIHVMYNTEVTPEFVSEINPYALIIAIGGHIYIPPIPGSNGINVIDGNGVYFSAAEKLGKRIVIVGGGSVGCETGLHLAKLGHNVTVLEMGTGLMRDSNHIHMAGVYEMLELYNIKTYLNTFCTAIDEKGVYAQDKDSNDRFFPCDTVVLAAGMKPNEEEALALRKSDVPYVAAIGDCDRVAKMKDAVHAGFFAALDIL